jgi:sugar lactone lactonase YvrE
MAQIDTVVSDGNLCGEGPVWDPARQRLIWNDMSSSLVYEYSPASRERRVLSRDLMVAGIALNDDGRLVFAGATGLHLWRSPDDCRTILAEHGGEKLNINDILAGSGGRLYFGTVYWGGAGMEKRGKLYRVEPDRSVYVEDDGIDLANGLGLSPDRRTLYFADSARRVIHAYDVAADGSLSRRRAFVRVPRDEGLPDGLTVDREGFVWSAQWYGGQVVRYGPDGKAERRVKMPAKQVSSVAFGGPDLSDLYVTSAGESWPSDLMPPGYDPDSGEIGGALYRVRPGVAGLPEHLAALR